MTGRSLELVAVERERHFNLRSSETDVRKSPNDWIATICSILGEGVERSGIPLAREDFERTLVKAAAVCVAALDHVDLLAENKHLG